MNKVLSIILIIFLSLLCIFMTLGFIFLLKSDFKFDSFSISTYSDNLLEKKEFDEITDIDISSRVADVFVEVSDNDKIVVELYSEKSEEYLIKLDENKIYVKLYNKNMGLNMFKKGSKVLVKIPKQYENKISIDSTVGDIKIDSFENLKLSVRNETGDIKIKKSYSLNVNASTGDVKIDEVKSITGKTGIGDVKIGSVNDVELTSATGDIKIERLNNKILVNHSVGDVKIESASINEDSRVSNKTGDIKIKTLKNAFIDAKTNVGDVKVNNNNRKSDVQITLTTNIGDIKVNN